VGDMLSYGHLHQSDDINGMIELQVYIMMYLFEWLMYWT